MDKPSSQSTKITKTQKYNPNKVCTIHYLCINLIERITLALKQSLNVNF